jgi:hypothetical protein
MRAGGSHGSSSAHRDVQVQSVTVRHDQRIVDNDLVSQGALVGCRRLSNQYLSCSKVIFLASGTQCREIPQLGDVVSGHRQGEALVYLVQPLTITCRIRPINFAQPKHCSMHFLLRWLIPYPP